MVVFEALVGCHDVLIFGESPIKWRQRPDMAIAADCDVKHQFKQTNNYKNADNNQCVFTGGPYGRLVLKLNTFSS